MKEEKMMILSMLEEGKITSEEAIKLMEALEDMETSKNNNDFTNQKNENDFREEKFGIPIFNTLEDIGSDIGNALSNMLNGLKDVGSPFGFRYNYDTITTDLDMDISHIENPSLDLRAINGSIVLRSSSENQILIKAVCQYKNGLLSDNEPYFDFYIDGNKIIFSPKYNSNISIKLDVSLPDKNYDEIVLNSTNGKIDLDRVNLNILDCITTNSSINIAEVKAKEVNLTSKNGKIQCKDINSNILKASTTNSGIFLTDIRSDEIDVKTANSRINVDDIDSKSIVCKTSNGSIEAKDITSEIIYLTTSNNRITCDDIYMDNIKDIKLITSNGSISSNIDNLNREAYFDLETSMGNITLDLPNLVYQINKQANLGLKKIVAHTVNFNENNNDLNFVATTSNGSIKIS